jgi:hypothetical protein
VRRKTARERELRFESVIEQSYAVGHKLGRESGGARRLQLDMRVSLAAFGDYAHATFTGDMHHGTILE